MLSAEQQEELDAGFGRIDRVCYELQEEQMGHGCQSTG